MTTSLFASSGYRKTLRKLSAGLLMLSMNLTGGLGALLLTTNVAEATIAPTDSAQFNIHGSYTWTAPAGVTSVSVEAWGAGGRGGSIASGSGEETRGGGGGGAYAKKSSFTVVPGTEYTMSVGAGSQTPSAGGDSYFIDIATLLAKGGKSATNNFGASGGAASESLGDTKFSGGKGAMGGALPDDNYGGGGGSSAGTASDGNPGSGATGGTVSGGFPGGNGAAESSNVGSSAVGNGGGGGGAYRSSDNSSGYGGGFGSDGRIVIRWTVPAPVYGCMDESANNYNSAATVEDDSCIYDPAPVYGCTDESANNYNVEATIADDSCTYDFPSCVDEISTESVVSDTTNVVEGTEGEFAVATFVHSAWTSLIGSTWIWDAYHVANPNQTEVKDFTKDFELTGTVTDATLEVAADNSFTVWVNGSKVAEDSTESNYASVKTYTIDPSLLVSGANTLRMEVTNFVADTMNPEANPAGAIYKLSMTKNTCEPIVPTPSCDSGTTWDGEECVTDELPPEEEGGSSTYDYWGCTNPDATNYNSLANKDDGQCELPGGTSEGGETPAGEVLGASTVEPEELPLPEGCLAYLTTFMKKGASNDADDVARLQTFLNENMNANLPVTGFFGSMTKTWVKSFQVLHYAETIQPWIDAGHDMSGTKDGSGVVYKTTRRAMNLMKCSSLDIPMPNLVGDTGL